MFNLFNKRKVNINSIIMPDMGWNLDKNETGLKQWINPEQTLALSINFFNVKPDLPTSFDEEETRNFYRQQLIAVNGGIIEVSKFNIKGFNAFRTIFKLPQDQNGIIYLASITIPFNDFSYVIKIQAPEIGVTGMRESVISMKLLSSGEITMSEHGIENWNCDPYNPKISDGALMNKSEDIKYDLEFPEHPLSKARMLLTNIEKEIKFSKDLEKIQPFGNKN